jgi:hypothetical protein
MLITLYIYTFFFTLILNLSTNSDVRGKYHEIPKFLALQNAF